MSKRALILGIGGQDGSYMAELLLAKRYEVHGLHRRSSVDNLWRIAKIRDRLTLHQGDLLDPSSINRAVEASKPQEIYSLADQDDVGWSFSAPSLQLEVTAGAVQRLLHYVKVWDKSVRIFQPLSATMYGLAEPPQNESTRLQPRSPYAVAKVAAGYLCTHYRREHGLFVSCGIMFNHDSPERSQDYVLHKICKAAVLIAQGKQKQLSLGNLEQQIDIGYAKEYMEAAHAMLQLEEPSDYCVGTGHSPMLSNLVSHAFEVAGVKQDWREVVVVDPKFYKRLPELPNLRADCTKARMAFGWDPQVKAGQLVPMLVKHYQEVLK